MSLTTVTCKNEPRGLCGLEGYQLGEAYRAQEVDNGYSPVYWRLWPVNDDDDYYQTCSPTVFKRFFNAQAA